jgi:type II restriction enzyme
MVDLKLYQKFYSVENEQVLVKKFQDTLITTNRTADFFVNWIKAKKNADEIKIELSLWNSLIGSNNIENDFVNLIKKYPEVIKTIPILLAIREREFPVIADFSDLQSSFKNLNFNKNRSSKLSSADIDDYLDFAKKGGLLSLFNYIKNFYDYVFGVEVGLDTNARKNRSGEAMETLLTPLLRTISAEIKCSMLIQKEFSSVQIFGGKFPQELANRKSDFILYLGNRFVNIETNYFSGTGSKPEEIVDSYINRRNELVKNNWSFIWVTDGDCWRLSENQILKAFKNMDYVFNIEFCRKGLFKEALIKIFGKD